MLDSNDVNFFVLLHSALLGSQDLNFAFPTWICFSFLDSSKFVLKLPESVLKFFISETKNSKKGT